MKWFKVSMSDTIKAVDSQAAVARFLAGLVRADKISIVDCYDVEVHESEDEEVEATNAREV
jgi:hypothetical protein